MTTPAADPAGGIAGTQPLRIGLLGAARISGLSIVKPARATGTRLVAVAARDETRARAFAEEHGVERALPSYDAVLADPDVEVVYNPLANGLHGPWNLRAIEAGKHVLTEKPSAANGEEARRIRDVVRLSRMTYMEAFHYPYHPLWHRITGLIEEGAIGELRHVDCSLSMPDPGQDDPRWRLDLAGGSTMDLGCYSLSAILLLGAYAGGTPELTGGRVVERAGEPGVDAQLWVDLEYPSGATASGGSSMTKPTPGQDFHLTVTGSQGSIHVPQFILPHEDDRLILRRADGSETVEHLGARSSYTYQLEALTDAVRHGAALLTDADFAVEVMDLIDAAYRTVGLDPRESTPL